MPSPIDAAQATPPIQKWSGADGAWMGEARFVTSRKVASEKFRLVRQGPAVVEYEARYTFDPQGEYVFRVRLSPGMPLAVVTEEFDFGEIGAGEDMLLLDLHRGWQPKSIGWVPGSGEQQLPALKSSAYRTYVDEKRKARRAEAPVGGVGQPPQPFQPEQGHGPAGDDPARRPLGRRQRRRPGVGRRPRAARLGPEHGTGPAVGRFVAASDGPVRVVPRGCGNHARLAVERPLVPLVAGGHRRPLALLDART